MEIDNINVAQRFLAADHVFRSAAFVESRIDQLGMGVDLIGQCIGQGHLRTTLLLTLFRCPLLAVIHNQLGRHIGDGTVFPLSRRAAPRFQFRFNAEGQCGGLSGGLGSPWSQ